MQHEARAWLWDVHQPANRIAGFVQDRSQPDYLADAMLRSAVERQFEIIGEALNRLSKEAPEVAARIPALRSAVAMRNALIHAYRDVNNVVVWRTVQENLPALRVQFSALLEELGEEP